ncbi:protein of unknown function [Pseudodesulfovibrio profundus]|uniref:Uncharacterized protein n=1 Tax=Pseudodesulfovibrio profundus TaxID=57320 RepID=A0A2C8F4H5_9BACT|nr:hypothetical protein [Pseudodesulfovibrio profundus]SOB57307.1 protein of unknown function [Pseudodesulfovibrio profundus]
MHVSKIVLSGVILTLTLFAPLGNNSNAAKGIEEFTPQGNYIGDTDELADLKEFLAIAAESNNELRAAFHAWQSAIKKVHPAQEYF